MRYATIQSQRRHYPIRMMCRLLDVSTSGFYAWLGRSQNRWQMRREALVPKIRKIHLEHRQAYGSPRIHRELQDQGESCCVHTVARIMRENKIQSKVTGRYRRTKQTVERTWIYPNVLERQFNPAQADQVWASDMTQISTHEGWLYLAIVMDLYSRKIIGWSMAHRMSDQLTIQALQSAIDARQPRRGLIHHSDQGSQYSSRAYQSVVKSNGMISSMSQKGNCYDNAVVESFFHTLKTEHASFQRYKTRREAKRDLFEWIEVYYNRKRRHSTLDYVSPAEYEMAA